MDYDLLRNSFQIEKGSKEISEEELLEMLTGRISSMIDENTDLLFSLLYRLDISEAKIKKVIDRQKDESISRGLAKLVLERQKERLRTKAKYRSDDFYFE
ncbi:hypothetical protein [Membranihabitans maritimus]|uniref:hypothetical protein n=1 Tax=Membranihabitans maritimus TaxID=2904244 RepID=UPI001F23842B|nr:hypothetical protein [Membranihabitans maritimus]